MDERPQSRTLMSVIIIAIVVIAFGVLWYTMRSPADDYGFDNATTTPRDTLGRTPSAQNENIVVYAPRQNDRVGTPIVIDGQARVFENTVNYRLRAADGTVIAQGFATANARDVGQFGTFRGELVYQADADGQGFIDVYSESAEDGSEINLLSIPVTYTRTPEFVKP